MYFFYCTRLRASGLWDPPVYNEQRIGQGAHRLSLQRKRFFLLLPSIRYHRLLLAQGPYH